MLLSDMRSSVCGTFSSDNYIIGGLHLINVDFQKSASSENNRLRSLYRPDLSKIATPKPLRKVNRDRKRNSEAD